MGRNNIAFIGSGNWARKYHFPALAHVRDEVGAPSIRLRGIFSLDQETAQTVATEYGFERVYASMAELLADDEIDAFAVAVLPEALVYVIEQIAPRGLPIFSEKPPGISSAQAQRLADLVQTTNVVAFNRRFIPLNNVFKEIVDEMDDVFFVEGHFFRHNRQDHAFALETGIHWINFMTYLFGPIRAVRNERWPHPQNDTWLRLAHLTFESGLRGLLKIFPCTGAQGERLEVHSPQRTAFLYGPLWEDPGEIVIEENVFAAVLHAPRLIRRTIPGGTGPELVERGIVGEYVEFFNAIHSGKPTRSNFQNAVNSMRVAEAIETGIDFVE
jgi:myo-inositol 2-dehydrogenase / D-chiro-inositol 1-dehydrogenase